MLARRWSLYWCFGFAMTSAMMLGVAQTRADTFRYLDALDLGHRGRGDGAEADKGGRHRKSAGLHGRIHEQHDEGLRPLADPPMVSVAAKNFRQLATSWAVEMRRGTEMISNGICGHISCHRCSAAVSSMPGSSPKRIEQMPNGMPVCSMAARIERCRGRR